MPFYFHKGMHDRAGYWDIFFFGCFVLDNFSLISCLIDSTV